MNNMGQENTESIIIPESKKRIEGGRVSSKTHTIHVYPAGSLPNLISESEKYNIEELTLTGELNGTDFRLIRDMAGCNYLGKKTSGKLRVLDFLGAKIVAGGEKYVDTEELPNWFGTFHYMVKENNELPQHLFHGCKFTSILISTSVTRIKSEAFYGCTGLTSITIPNSVTSIGRRAFRYCSNLSSIIIESGNKRYDSRNSCNAIVETSSNRLITGCKNTTIPNSVTSIGSEAFRGCNGLISITIPDSVTSIGSEAFSDCI